MSHACAGCQKPDAQMQCPTCKKLGLPTTYFCTQECFKASWNAHKPKHSEPPRPIISTMSDVDLLTFNFSGPLRPGKITPRRQVPEHIVKPDYATRPDGMSPSEEADRSLKAVKHNDAMIEKIRRVCKLSREVLDIACNTARPGVNTDEIDRVVHEATIERGMYPSPLNYYNFPKSVCTSVNEIICHGIPDSRELEPGDIVNLDVSSFLDGVHGDLNETVFVGKPDEDSVKLVHCAFECLMAGIATVGPDALYKHVGDAIEARAAQSGCSVVRTYTGHGVGPLFHSAPTVAHYANNKSPGVMQPGHVFTIEPMINFGTWHDVTWPDRWTSSTKDGKRSAQFEHTMVVRPADQKVELLTNWTDGVPHYQKQLATWGITPQ